MQEFININDISETLMCSKSHALYRITKRPDFPVAIKVGRQRLWYKHEFMRWLSKQRER